MPQHLSKIIKSEIEAAIIIILLTIGFFFLPNHTIDPWNLINPKRFGFIILLIASIQFGGYFAIQIFGHRMGIALVGLFGGFISSTIIFLTLPKIYKSQNELLSPLVAAAILAVIGMLIEFLIILYSLSASLFDVYFHPILVMIIVGIVSTLILTRGKQRGRLSPEKMNPLDLKSVLKLAVWLFSMLILITLAIRFWGTESGAVVSFLGGFFELHSVSIATATLYVQEKLSLGDATLLLSLALLAAFLSKFIIICILSRNRFAWLTSFYLGIMLMAGFIIYLGQ